MPVRVPKDVYCRVNEYQKIIGYKSSQPIYRAIREGRLPGAVNVGTEDKPYWIVPTKASIINKTIRHGGYIGVSARAREAKKNWLTTHDKL